MNRFLPRLDMRSAGILLLVLASCLAAYLLYPHPEESLKSDALDGEKTEIVYWTTFDPNVFDPMKPVLEEFERRNPQYKVLLGTATARDITADPTRFLLSVAGGVPPDLIWFDRFAIVEWASRGAFDDLTPYLEADLGKPDAIQPDDIYDVAWNECVYKDKIFGIPCDLDTRALFYADDSLIRAGFVYSDRDPEVLEGKAAVGEARPPKTWEEVCLKKAHLSGRIAADGTITFTSHVRRQAVNEDVPAGEPVDLYKAGVRIGDVISIIAGSEVFRGRIKSLDAADKLVIDLNREQPRNMNSMPQFFRGDHEVKIFDQDTYASRLTRFDPMTGEMTAVGFIPLLPTYGNSWLYLYGWLNGGKFMSEDGSKVLLDSKEIVEAMQWVSDTNDSMGGYRQLAVFTTSAASSGLDPFITQKVVMVVHTTQFIGFIRALRPDMHFGVTAAPMPQERLEAGQKPLGWVGGFAYAIPSTAKKKEAAWELIKWMASPEASSMLIDMQAQIFASRGQPYFPPTSSNKKVVEWIREKYIRNNPDINEDMVKAFDTFVELLPMSKYRPVTPVGQKLWSEQLRATNSALTHVKQPYEALNYGRRRVQTTLDTVLTPPTGPVVNWKIIITIYLLVIFSIFAGLAIHQEYRQYKRGNRRGRWMDGYIAASPWLFGFVVFGAGPIVFSLIISFCHYDVLNPARFIGLANYVNLLGFHFDSIVNQTVPNDPIFWKSLYNTLFMVLSVPLSIVLGLAIALLLDTRVRGLHIYRTFFYLPAIVPAVATFILWLWLLDPARGMFNQFLTGLGLDSPPAWLQDPNWSKPSLIIMMLWGVGASMIIWLAGLKDIPDSMYEAASIDGANRFQQFMTITLPLLSPYIFFNMVMGLIAVFQIFEQAFVMTDGGPADSTLFYAYKLFNEAFRYLNMGAASAMAWLLFIIVLVITMLQLWLSKKWVHYGG